MSESIVDRIVERIAEREEVEPADLDTSLESYVSTDAIRKLESHESSAWVLEFEIPNHVVTVAGDGEIRIAEAEVSTSS